MKNSTRPARPANEIYENRYENRDRWVITSRTDLATYLANTRMDLDVLGDKYIDAVIDQLQASDHPAWGDDWSEWLAEWTDSVITETVAGLDAIETE